MRLRHRAAPPPPPRKVDWPRDRRALGALIHDPEGLRIEPAPQAHPQGIPVDRKGTLFPTRRAALGYEGTGTA
jgi:hypothetical protein